MAHQVHTAHTWPQRGIDGNLFRRLYKVVTSPSNNAAPDGTDVPLRQTSQQRLPSPDRSRPSRSSSPNSMEAPDFDRKASETASVTVVKSHSGRVLLRYWIHVVAIGLTAASATINFLSLYLMDVDAPDAQVALGAFQFVAKFHELIILGSLVMVIMDLIRAQLLRNTGVPLGLLLSNVLFTDMEWLISSNFWASLSFRRQGLQLTLLVIVSIPFANLAGPLSAVTIVPRLGWSQPHPAQIFPRFYNGSATQFWPDQLTAESLPQECFENYAERVFPCPSSVFYEQNYGPDFACTSSGSELSCNGTMFTSYAGAANDGPIARPMSAELNVNENTVYSSTPVRLIYQDLVTLFTGGVAETLNISNTESIDALKMQLIETRFLGNQDMFKPLVKASCASITYAEAVQMITERDLPNVFGAGSVTILDDIDGSSTPKLLYTVDRRSGYLSQSLRGDCKGDGCFAAFTCTAQARWIPFKIWYNTAQSTLLFQSDPQPKKLFESNTTAGSRTVVLKKDWLDAMIAPQAALNDTFKSFNISETWPGWNFLWDPRFEGQPPKLMSGLNIQQPYKESNYTQGLAMQFSTILTEALARSPSFAGNTGYDGNCSDVDTEGFVFSKEICAQSPSYWVHADSLGDLASTFSAITFTVRKSGYGWGLDSALVTVSLAVLLSHALLTLIYLIAVLAFKRQITTCWGSAPELFVLAISSLKAPVLMGHSARMSRHDRHLWHEAVTVREVAGSQGLTLIVGDPSDYSGGVGGLPRVGKKYA